VQDIDREAIDRFYEALRMVKRYLVEHGVAELFQPCRGMFPSNMSFAAPMLPEEVKYDFEQFLHYDCQYRYPITFLEFRTEDRMAFIAHHEALADLLFQAGFNVKRDESWRWGDEEPVHICHPVYEIRFWPQSAGRAPQNINEIRLCRAPDPRVDDSPWRVLRRAGHKLESGGLCERLDWGLRFSLYTRADANAVKATFSDCQITETIMGKGENRVWEVEVTFADAQTEAA